MWTENFLMFKLVLEKAEEPEIKLPTSTGSWKSKRVPEKNLLMFHWLCQRLWLCSFQFSSVQSLSRVRLFVTPWIAARQASLSITNSRSSLRPTSIKSVMPSSHLILCHPLLLLPPIPPSIRVFTNESTLHMRWPKYWSFSFSIIPAKKSGKVVWYSHLFKNSPHFVVIHSVEGFGIVRKAKIDVFL